MQCDYFDAGACRSCTHMGRPYADQLTDKAAHLRSVLADHVPDDRWTAPHPSREAGFRNKAKLVVGGRRGDPLLGILADDGTVTDLRHCGLYEPGLRDAVLALPRLVGELGLTPYDVPSRNGELKHVLVTHSPDGELMIRFVLRSPGQLPRLREGLQLITAALPSRVVTANLQPDHKAVLEGPDEVVLTDTATLPMRLGEVTLHLRPQSFFQTNTVVAQGLYAQATNWLEERTPRELWDLYCGVGGFALHAMASATPPARTVGIEVSTEAIQSARQSASELVTRDTLSHSEFHATTAFAHAARHDLPDAVVVNPPRRGIGPELAALLEQSAAATVLYSSCNATSLSRDLAAMPSLRVTHARLFDMFPQTDHHEVLVMLERAG